MSSETKKPQLLCGVRYVIYKNELRFAASDVAKVFGFTYQIRAVTEHCKNVYKDNAIRNVTTIDCQDLLALATKAPHIPPIFVDALYELIERLREEGTIKMPTEQPTEQQAESQAAINDEVSELKTEVSRLKELLGQGDEYKIVRAIPWFGEIFDETNRYAVSAVSGQLLRLSSQMNKPVRLCKAFGYHNTVQLNMYHKDVIAEFYRIVTSDTSRCPKVRKKAA